jgi:hypothetical protein
MATNMKMAVLLGVACVVGVIAPMMDAASSCEMSVKSTRLPGTTFQKATGWSDLKCHTI